MPRPPAPSPGFLYFFSPSDGRMEGMAVCLLLSSVLFFLVSIMDLFFLFLFLFYYAPPHQLAFLHSEDTC